MLLIVKAEHEKMRVDAFLKEHVPDLSRALLQKMVKAKQVTVNGEYVTPHHFLKAGDEVEAIIDAPVELRVVPNPEIRLEVIHEEPDFLIINKPVGLVVHQGEGHKEPDTLANGLLAQYPEIGKVGDDPVRPGIVHRLDKEVSGVMVIARTQEMFDSLKTQFKTRTIEKEYVAIVHGTVTPPHGFIDFAIAHKGAKMIARPKGSAGKAASTEYEVVKSKQQNSRTALQQNAKENTNLLKVIIHSGRTHQIRVHLLAIDHPIVGDQLYAYKPASNRTKNVVSDRLMLHARRLAFKDLLEKKREFIVEPPQEFSV